MSNQSDSAAGGQVISRAAAILRTLAERGDDWTLTQISAATDLPKTTVHRMVGALEAQGLVSITPRGIGLGEAFATLAASAHRDVVGIARPFIESLGRRLRETVDLCVHRGSHAVSVYQFPCDRELRVISPVGTAFPIHCTAHGKALLAALPDQRLLASLPDKLERRTVATIVDRQALLEDINAARDRGYALDDQEHSEGVCAVGVTLGQGHLEGYALSIAVPSIRFHANLAGYLAALNQCNAEILEASGTA